MSGPVPPGASYLELIFQGVDMASDTYITWESVVCPPDFRRVNGAKVDALKEEFDRALPGTGAESAGQDATLLAAPRVTANRLSEADRAAIQERLGRCLVDFRENVGFMCELVEVLDLGGFTKAVQRESARAREGERVLVILNPPPKLGQIPWEMLPLDVEGARAFLKDHEGRDDLSDTERPRVLLDIADVVTMAPLLRRDADPSIPHPAWTPGAGMYLVEPWDTGRGDRAVLQRADQAAWRERVNGLGNQAVAPPREHGHLADRIWLSEALRANAGDAGAAETTAAPITRMLYIGHIKGTGEESALLLNDRADVYGLGEVDHNGFRWLSAMDLTKGTTTWREKKYDRINQERASRDGRRYPNGERLPGGLRPTADENGEETVPAVEGWDLWPMPPRVGLIACHSGSEAASAEPFGLAAGCLEAGAELVFATRWTMYTDRAFEALDPSERPHPFNELAIEVDKFLQSETPIEDMSEWKRRKLENWRRDPTDVANAPITWAGLTVYRAPDRAVKEDAEPVGP